MGETAGDSAEAPGHGADAFEDWSDDEVHQQHARLHPCTAYKPGLPLVSSRQGCRSAGLHCMLVRSACLQNDPCWSGWLGCCCRTCRHQAPEALPGCLWCWAGSRCRIVDMPEDYFTSLLGHLMQTCHQHG